MEFYGHIIDGQEVASIDGATMEDVDPYTREAWATIALGGYLAYRQRPARAAFLMVPLTFGLIHGLGFAAAAADKLQGIRGADLGKLLLGFNLGVETAQASLIVVTAGALYGLGKMQADTTKARRWLGASIALVGVAIMVLRTWGLVRGA